VKLLSLVVLLFTYAIRILGSYFLKVVFMKVVLG